jgi:2-succinyl-6-hydroxy-2,4-cyclohexadiene-1-carboxylate synthase
MSLLAAGTVDWHVEWHGDPGQTLLTLVHGFAGSRHTWDEVLHELVRRFRVLLVDLPGHGGSPVPDDPQLDLHRLGISLGQLIRNAGEGPAYLCGYSLGGRVALHTALFAPEMVRGLGLIGASPGIADDRERLARRKVDQELAAKIRQNGIAWFADYWADLPLFESQKLLPTDIRDRLHRARRESNVAGLAYCLEHFGTGTQEYLLPRLHTLRCPLLLMAGQLDAKFCDLNHAMELAVGDNYVRRAEIANAGHAAHIEAPLAVSREIISFFNPLP